MKKYLLILFFAFCCFLCISKVNALQFYIENTQMGTGVKYFTNGNANINTSIRDNNNDFPLFLDLSVVPQYGYVAICSADGSLEDRYIDSALGSNISNVNVVNSTVGCTIPGVTAYSATARVVYFTFNIDLDFWSCSAQGTSCVWPSNGRLGLTFWQPKSNEYSLISYGFSSNEPYNFNDTIDPKVKLQEQQNQLQQQQNQLQQQQNQILEDNLTTCIDSRNLLNYSFSSPTTFNSVVYTLNSDKSITANGVPSSSNMFSLYGSSNQLLLEPGTYTLSGGGTNAWVRLLNSPKQEYHDSYGAPITFTITETTSYYVGLRIGTAGVSNFTFYPMLVKGSSSLPYEPYGQTCGVSTLEQQNKLQQEQIDLINNDDVNESSSTGSDFFNNFNTSNHGLTGIITAPLNLITSITSKTCAPLVLPLPFVNQNLELPCMSSIYSQYFGSFYDIYKVITFGIVAYWVCVRIFNLVKDFKNPEHDEIEVVDL